MEKTIKARFSDDLIKPLEELKNFRLINTRQIPKL
jgi:hypothetical protein